MSKQSPKKGISRRKFIQGVGTGVVSSSVLIDTLKASPKGSAGEALKPHEGSVPLSFKVNGKEVRVKIEPTTTLVEVLRDHLKLTGTKVSCDQGECGACTVLVDGKAIYSCHFLALDAAGKDVITVEGLPTGDTLHPIQEAFIEHDGMQCGFCTSGQVMATQALLLKNPKPSKDQVLKGMSGNLCRCGAYPHIIDSVLDAAEKV
jgi:xanthine dehydrogenase YagT iron-sulfur-binding subunit